MSLAGYEPTMRETSELRIADCGLRIGLGITDWIGDSGLGVGIDSSPELVPLAAASGCPRGQLVIDRGSSQRSLGVVDEQRPNRVLSPVLSQPIIGAPKARRPAYEVVRVGGDEMHQ